MMGLRLGPGMTQYVLNGPSMSGRPEAMINFICLPFPLNFVFNKKLSTSLNLTGKYDFT
jgi:hypothetical protein